MKIYLGRTWLFIIFISLTNTLCFSLSATNKTGKSPQHPKVYTSLGADDTTTNRINKICHNNVVNINVETNTNSLTYNVALLSKKIISQIPNKESTDIVVLDWEGDALSVLSEKDPDSDDYKKVSEQFISAYNLVKSLRPNATCGFYGLPIRAYWKRNNAWIQHCTNLSTILSHFDALFPSLYIPYKDNVDVKESDNLSYISDNVNMALKLGFELKKPVYFYIWHRYHDSNSKYGLDLIPENYFRDHVKAISLSSYNGKKTDGIIWWSAECYFNNILTKKKNNIELKNYKFSDTNTLLRYLQIINKNL
ncbi:MAG: hypothetical protein Q8861_02670 [Bacteroidota bacterium]|nr:hypothetical protein [Bacteroidota bacterium]